MDLDDILLISRQLRPVQPGAVAAAEATLGCRFPAGYAAYVERFGEGDLGDLVRVYPPDKVLTDREEWRERITEYWFWETAAAGVTPELIRECVLVADSLNGDEFCFHPADPDTLFALPRDFDEVYRLAPGLMSALDWALRAGVLVDPGPDPVAFHPWHDRAERRLRGRADYEAVTAGLLGLGLHGAVGRGVDRPDFGRRDVYLPAVGGWAAMWRFGTDEVDVLVRYDATAPSDVVASIVEVLEAEGLVGAPG